jgi:putative N6-adenine-specific DNA methylase
MASYFCPCPRGMEAALAEEIGEIAAQSTTLKVHNQVPGGVHCSGTMQDAWLLNLHSRIASRVLMRMAQRSYTTENDIYDLVLEQTWEDWFGPDHTIRVDVTAVKSPLRSLEFTTLKIKDAICDRFRDQYDKRPSVNTREPDMRIVGFLDARNFIVYLDTSGEALFKRGWREETGDAPLRLHRGPDAARDSIRRAPQLRLRKIRRPRPPGLGRDEGSGQAERAAAGADHLWLGHLGRHGRNDAP